MHTVDYNTNNFTAWWTESIHTYIFENCESLVELTLPIGMQMIDVHTFSGCTNLKKVKFLDTKVQFRAAGSGTSSQIFYGCKNLETVEFAEGTEEIKCFHYNTNWRDGEFGVRYDLTQYIGYLFANCTSLKYVGVPNAQGVIEENTLPGYTGNIHSYMFADTAIENFTLPSTTQTIAGWAFIGCKEISEIEFPASLTTI